MSIWQALACVLVMFWVASVILFVIGWLRTECARRRQPEPQVAPEITPEGP